MDILSVILFLLLISSGSIFASSFFSKKYEEVLPITCTGIVVLGFVFGLMGLLKYSTVVICLVALVLTILGIIKALKDYSLNELLKNTFTPGFVIFVILSCYFFLGTHGKLFDTTDEFSHWGDIVKVMTTLDVFGTNEISHSMFKSYPPAMSLFQYTLEEIYCFISGNTFCEWLCYMAYDILCVSFILPITNKLSFKKPLSILATISVIILIPYIFYRTSYFSVYIDQFLSFLIVSGAITLIYHEKNDIHFLVRMCTVMFMLVLSKDTGLLFAVIFAISTIVVMLLDKQNGTKKNNIFSIVTIVLSVVLPKVLWNLNISLNNADVSFSNKVDFKSLILVLLGREDSYRRQVIRSYARRLLVVGPELGWSTVTIVYFAVLIIGIFVICYLTNRIAQEKESKALYCEATKYSLICSAIFFIIGLCVIYMYKFSEEEATILASFNRYVDIVFLAMWLFIGLVIIVHWADKVNYKLICGATICLLVVITDFEVIFNFVTGAYTSASIKVRENYKNIIDKTLTLTEGQNKIWFIYQDYEGEDGLIYQFGVRPNYVDGSISIHPQVEEDDNVSEELSSIEWKKQLLEKNYDYVVIMQIDDEFIEAYKDNFKKTSDINNESVYKVDKNTGLLALCE